jgi:cytochrome c oxidase accessory protein FixG
MNTPDGSLYETEVPLFGERERVYPKRVKGRIRRIKWAVLIACLALYYIGPWLRWDRGLGRPDQALLIDMPARRAYFFGVEIWPQELYYLAGLLILGALALFFVTSLFGRLWCGYACPQTVWTDLYMWVERAIEGDRVARMRLDQKPFGWNKAAKKIAKHGAWLVIAAVTGGAWIMYFNDAPTVSRNVLTGNASLNVYFFFGLFTATTYILAGWAREQVCTYMCPWPRIQSAMVDEDTLTVIYRYWRGEPRGKHAKGQSWEGRGDCIDCRACVQVCPTGIDIRDGLQLECIGCGLCIDACNDIMTKVQRPAGLIAFDTPAARGAELRGEKYRYRLIRPRTILYAVVFLTACGILLGTLLSRSATSLEVLRDRAPLFVKLPDGAIRNGYTVKIQNKEPDTRYFVLRTENLNQGIMHIEDAEIPPSPAASEHGIIVSVPGDSIGTFRVLVRAPRQQDDDLTFDFEIADPNAGTLAEAKTTFRGPKTE